MRYFPHQALTFAFKDKFKAAMAKLGGNDTTSTPLWKIIGRNILAGGAGGGVSLVLLYPLDMARTRLAADTGAGKTRRFTGTIDCLQKIYAENGIRGVYTGLSVSITGVIVFRGLFLGGYDSMKHIMDLDGEGVSTRGVSGDSLSHGLNYTNILKRLLGAQAVTLTEGTLCYPIDTVRRRVMMQSKKMDKEGSKTTLRYRGAIHAFVTILREEGIRGLYSGLSANLIRGFAGPILLVSYDVFKAMQQD